LGEKEGASPEPTTPAEVEERRHPMTISLDGRLALRELMEQAEIVPLLVET
jgi:hypothetical protein